MKNEEFLISEYNEVDGDLLKIIDFHKQIFNLTNLKGILIYYHPNFVLFFRNKLIKSKKDYFFLIKNGAKLIGFSHFKIMNKVLFLNNIFILPEFQGKGLGKKVLKHAFDYFREFNLDYFELDVLSSNDLVFNWYKSIGLRTVSTNSWVEIKGIHSFPNSGFIEDENGFDSLFCRNEKIATVINKNVIIHRIEYLNKTFLNGFQLYTNQSIPLSKMGDIKVSLLDNSIRMSCKIGEILI